MRELRFKAWGNCCMHRPRGPAARHPGGCFLRIPGLDPFRLTAWREGAVRELRICILIHNTT